MTAHSEPLADKSVAGRRSGAIMATLIVAVPLVLALVCVLARLDIIELSQSVRAELLFAHAARPDGDRHADLDRARAVGADLSVHSLQRRSEDGGAETLHQHRPLRDHGDPVLHPGRQFSHLRRGGAPHDRFRHLADRALVWRPRPRRRRRLRAVRGDFRLVGGDRGRHRLDHPAGDRAERLSAALRRRRDRDLGRARHPVSAVDQSGDLRGRDQRHAAEGAGRARSWIPLRSASCSSPGWCRG